MATPQRPFGPLGVLTLATWLGAVAGLLEIAAKYVSMTFGWHGHFSRMSRHFVWLIPASNLVIFVTLGLVLAPIVWALPRAGGWASKRLLGALALLPALIVLLPEIYTVAWFTVGWGVMVRLVPIVENHAPGFRRFARISFPLMISVVVGSACWIFGGDAVRESRERARPLPPIGSPNILMVVLDTVRADHLSAYGYERQTTPTLEGLASRGIRFDSARSTAPWTLASHASLFTGKLPHELRVRYMSSIRRDVPTLAGYLGSKGYATAGFVANVLYCGRETGLAEGFTHYEDFRLQGADPLLMSRLAYCGLMGTFTLFDFVRNTLRSEALAPLERFVGETIVQSGGFSPIRRKDAATINRDFLAWLSARGDTARPFFAFLNFYDAHTPYFPPHPGDHRFGLAPRSPSDENVLLDWEILDKPKLPSRLKTLARDCYDDCIRSLDDQLRRLFTTLGDRGLLNNTVVIVTADHGEGFGEHDLWVHAESLYLPEVHVPLIVMAPRFRGMQSVVTEPVSLIDLPATVVDLAGLAEGSPFPGHSLVQNQGKASTDSASVSELSEPDPTDPNQGRSPARLGPLTSIERGRYRYIHRSKAEREELFDVADDPEELHDISRDLRSQPILDQFRADLSRVLKTR